jgi:hypothetical protein
VLGIFGRRTVDLVILLFAAYAFAFVPLGKRTGLEHVRAILRTHAAQNAGHEVTIAAQRLWHKLVDDADQSASSQTPLGGQGRAVVPKLKN